MWHSIAIARARRAAVTATSNGTTWRRCRVTSTHSMPQRQYLYARFSVATDYAPFTADPIFSPLPPSFSCCSAIRAFSSSVNFQAAQHTLNSNDASSPTVEDLIPISEARDNSMLPSRPPEQKIEELLCQSVSSTIKYARTLSDYIRALSDCLNQAPQQSNPIVAATDLAFASSERERARTELSDLFLHLWLRYVAPNPAFIPSAPGTNTLPEEEVASPVIHPPPLHLLSVCIEMCRENQLAEQGLLFTSLLIDAAKKTPDAVTDLPQFHVDSSASPRRAFHLQPRAVRSAILCARYNPHLVYSDERAAWNSVAAILADMRNFPQYFRLDQSIFHALFAEAWDTHTPAPLAKDIKKIHGIPNWLFADTGKHKKLSGGYPLVIFNTISPHVRLYAEVLVPYLERMKMQVRVGLQDKNLWSELNKRVEDVWKHATQNHTVSAVVTKQYVQTFLLSTPLLQHHQFLHLRDTLTQRCSGKVTSSNITLDQLHMQEVYDSFQQLGGSSWTALQGFMCPRTVEEQVNRCNELLLKVLRVCKACKMFNSHPQALFVPSHITVTPDVTAIVLQAILDVMELLSQPIAIKAAASGASSGGKKKHTDPQEKLGFIQELQWDRLEELVRLQLELGALTKQRFEHEQPQSDKMQEQRELLSGLMDERQLTRIQAIWDDMMRVRKKLYKQIGKETNAKTSMARASPPLSTTTAPAAIVNEAPKLVTTVRSRVIPAATVAESSRTTAEAAAVKTAQDEITPAAVAAVEAATETATTVVEAVPLSIEERFLAEIAQQSSSNPDLSVLKTLDQFESILSRFKQQNWKIATPAPFVAMLELLLKQHSKSPVTAATLAATFGSVSPSSSSSLSPSAAPKSARASLTNPSASFLLVEEFFLLCHQYGIPLSTREFHLWFAQVPPRSSDESIAIVELLEGFGLDADRMIFRGLASILAREMLDSVRAHAKLEVLLQHMEIVRERFDAQDFNFILRQLMGPAAAAEKNSANREVDEEDEADDLPSLHEQSLIEWAERASLAGLWDSLDPPIQLAVIAALERTKSDSQPNSKAKPLPTTICATVTHVTHLVSEVEAHPVRSTAASIVEESKPFVCCMQSGDFEFGKPGFNFSIRSFILSHTCPNFVQCQTLASAKAAAAVATAPSSAALVDREEEDESDRAHK